MRVLNNLNYKQVDDDSCGPATVDFVLRRSGREVPYSEILRLSDFDPAEGMSNAQLVKTLRLFGLRVKEKNSAEISDLEESIGRGETVVVSWMLDGYCGHFSVVDSISTNEIVLLDPMIGAGRRLGLDVFLRLWLDYDEHWYPRDKDDIQLRWMCAIEP